MKNGGLQTAAAVFAAGCALGGTGWRTTGFAQVAGDRVVVEVPAGKESAGGMAMAEFDVGQYADGFVAEIRCRGENISKTPLSWHGLKFMFKYDDAGGVTHWPQAVKREGSFDWCTLTLCAGGPGFSAKGGRGLLVLGLQAASGSVEFDLSSLKIRPARPLWPVANGEFRVKYPAHFPVLGRGRGVMLPGGLCKEEDFALLKEWGATLGRYQMIRGWGLDDTDRDLADYDKWLDGKLDHLERVVLPLAAKYGVMIVVDLHVPPGGRHGGEMNMFHEREYADHFVACWRRIAGRFKGRPEIYGYDLVNEPQQQFEALPECDYWTLQRRAAEAVREVDPDATVVIESNGWDCAGTFSYLSPLAMDNVVYEFHMYWPMEFTHQGVGGGAANWKKAKYPDPARGWDKEGLRKALAPVVAFQRKHGARIYAGEFSAVAWAEGAGAYIADCISLFEEYGFDWTYHAFREWQGWSVEHECDGPGEKFRPSKENDRQQALREGLALSRGQGGGKESENGRENGL